MFFDAEELEVHAIALAPGGGLYVGTSPDGKIYKVDAAGKGTVFFDPPDRYIWSLAVDRAGNVFAGTGDKGVIYKITPDGKGAPFYQTKATHAMTLAFDRDGRLLAGTESPGRVFQIDANGKPFVLLDSPYNEIHTLRVDPKGVIYAAAVSGRGAATPIAAPSRCPTPRPSASRVGVGLDRSHRDRHRARRRPASGRRRPAAAARSNQGQGAGAMYRIMPDGASDLVWQLREDSPYDLAFDADGSILVATGNEGKIYRLVGRSAAADAGCARQRPAGHGAPARPRRDGCCLRPPIRARCSVCRQARADRGTYTSDVRDAQTVADVGRDQVAGDRRRPARKVDISTRSGNTRTPDETWSDWSTAYTDREGSAISSPRARYLQWRAVLTGPRSESPAADVGRRPRICRATRVRASRRSPFIRRAPCFSVRSPPAIPEIAGFEGDTPDRRAAAQTAGGGGQPNLGRRVVSEGSADVRLAGRGRQPRRPHLRRALSPRGRRHLEAAEARPHRRRSSSGTRRRCPNGRYLAPGRRVGRAVELAGHRADRLDGEHDVRHRQHAADHRRHRRPPRRRAAR